MFLQLKLIYFKGNVLKQEGIQHKGKNRMLNPYCSTADTLVAGCGTRYSSPLVSAWGFFLLYRGAAGGQSTRGHHVRSIQLSSLNLHCLQQIKYAFTFVITT